MKRIISIKPLLAIITIAVFAIVFKSCKKADSDVVVNTKEIEEAKQKLITALKEQYGNLGTSVIYPVNKDAEELFYNNTTTGKMVKHGENLQGREPNGVLKPCFYNCSNTTNPNLLTLTYTVESIQRTYYCPDASTPNRTNDIVVNWKISVPFTPLTADPNNAANPSTGSVQITPPFGPSIGSSSIAPVVISSFGPDPNCSANTLYKVSYTFTNVANAAFNNGYPIIVSLNLYNNCGLVGNFVNSGYVSATLAGKTAPCDRTDRVGLDGNTGPGGCKVANGTYLICSPPPGLITPDQHQLEYRAKTTGINGSNAWETQTSNIYYGRIPFTTTNTATFGSFNGFLYLLNMIPGSGTWIVRYRNIKNPTCTLIGSQNIQVPIPSPGNTWAGNWAIEVFSL